MRINLHNTVIESVSTRKDGSVKVVLGMLEMPPQEMAELFSVVNKDVATISADVTEDDKSPSKRLRDRMYVYYKEKHSGASEGFSAWYVNQMDSMGLRYLEKLDSNKM